MNNYAARRLGPHEPRCSEDGCESKIHARGFCQKHYKQVYFDRKNNCVVTAPRHEGLVRVGVKGWGAL